MKSLLRCVYLVPLCNNVDEGIDFGAAELVGASVSP